MNKFSTHLILPLLETNESVEAAYFSGYGNSLISSKPVQEAYKKWFSKNIVAYPGNRIKVASLYSDYKAFISLSTNQEPLGKRSFISLFRNSLNEIIRKNELCLLSRGSLEVIGLDLVQNIAEVKPEAVSV